MEGVQGLDFSFVYGGATNSTLTLGNTSTVALTVSTTTGNSTLSGGLLTDIPAPVNTLGGQYTDDGSTINEYDDAATASLCHLDYSFSDAVQNVNSSVTNEDVVGHFDFDETLSGTLTREANAVAFNTQENSEVVYYQGTIVTTSIAMEQTPDANASGYYTFGACPDDTDGDGLLDIYEVSIENGQIVFTDTDGDGIPDYLDVDDDGDGILTANEMPDNDNNHEPNDALDTDGDGIPNYLDVDDDGDGYATWETLEGGPGFFNPQLPDDTDGNPYTTDDDQDGIPNYLDNTNGNYQVTGPIAIENYVSLTGDKRYELANHLGNVLVVISDKKIPNLNASVLENFNADVLSYSDYYPFGQLLPNRHASSDSYRYGFQGQEKDDEIKGEGNSINYTFRMHDPRVGRFFAVDPLTAKYPWYSPYQFGGNSPIMSIELEGLEESKTANENQHSNEKPGFLERLVKGYINIFDSWSRIKGVNKYKGDSFPEQVSNSLEGFREFATNDTFLFLGAVNQPGFQFDLGVDDYADDAVRFGPKINSTFRSAKELLNDLKKLKTFQVSGSVNFGEIFNGAANLKKLFPLTVDGWERAIGGGRAWGRVDGEQIAFYTIGKKGLQMEINLPKHMQNLGYGAEFFATAVRESEATVFTATWVKSGIYETGQSVNLTKYQSALAKGLTSEEAAFKTWSGQQAAKHGFKNVKVTEIENGIEATFTK